MFQHRMFCKHYKFTSLLSQVTFTDIKNTQNQRVQAMLCSYSLVRLFCGVLKTFYTIFLAYLHSYDTELNRSARTYDKP